jgi:hypothetical protein
MKPHHVFAAAVGAVILSGCGPEGGADQLTTYDVTAHVTADGKPVSDIQLTMTATEAGHPNSAANLSADGTGKFSTYGPEDGIPAGAYTAGLMYSGSNPGAAVPSVKPLSVTVTEDMDGKTLDIAFETTGKKAKPLLPRP